MTTAIRQGHGVLQLFKAATASIIILSPSIAAGVCLLENQLPLQEALRTSVMILFLASVNIAVAIMLDPYRHNYSKLAPLSLIGMVTVVLLYAIFEALNRFFGHLNYGLLAPLVGICQALIYTTVFLEKSTVMKCLLSLSSIALMFLYALGAADKFTMPF